jgi:hypothetical protein
MYWKALSQQLHRGPDRNTDTEEVLEEDKQELEEQIKVDEHSTNVHKSYRHRVQREHEPFEAKQYVKGFLRQKREERDRAKLIRKKQDIERRLARVRYGEELERIDSEIGGMAKRQKQRKQRRAERRGEAIISKINSGLDAYESLFAAVSGCDQRKSGQDDVTLVLAN